MATNNQSSSIRLKRQMEEQNGYISRLTSTFAQVDWTAFGSVLLLVILAAYLRFYFDFGLTTTGGFPSLSGGSDADFYFNVLTYALSTGHQLLFDPMLNYPLGSYNPFLPFYVWMTVLITWPTAFFFHLPLLTAVHSGRLDAAVAAFSAISAISGIVSTIIAYYLGKELFSKEAGIIAAAFVAFLPSLLSESTAGFGVHDPFVLMLTALFFFFLFRSLNTIQGHRWIESWKSKNSYLPDFVSIDRGLRLYFSENKRSLLYAFMSGVVLASIANAWEGYSYIVVIVSLFYLIQSFIYKFKNRDTLALTAIYFVQNITLLTFSFDVYYTTHSIYPWYYVSIVFFLGTMLLGIVYTVARDIPWLTLLTALVAAVLVIVGIFELVDRRFLHTIVARILLAQSYFIKSPVYTTIAEALAPPFSLLVLSLGGAVFFIAFAQLLYMLYRPRKLDNSHTLLVIWFIIATYMAVSTVRFVLDATTVFALLAAQGLVSLINWVNFGEVRKGVENFGLSWTGLRRSVKIKHILAVLFVAFVISMPVSWMAIDAATPTTLKQTLNTQVYNLLPSFLHPPGYVNNGSNPFYFGGFGYSLESPNTYFPAEWAWLDNYTSNIVPYSARPAYLSWWDYGSEVVTFAQVPTVADDFQQGYHLASAFLFSENETQAISLLTARLIYGSFVANHSSLSTPMSSLLSSYGINVTYVINVLRNPASYTSTVLSNPAIYGPFASSVTPPSVMYAVLMVTLSKIGLNNAVNLYQQVSKLTGKFIDFFSVDSRLIPFSATDTGVFYAPAFLGGRPVAGPGVYNVPYDYYQIEATTTTGFTYPIQDLPPGSQVSSYTIQYQPLFYNMTLYRFFLGYSGYDITGQNISGLPGISGAFLSDPEISSFQPLPGWMLSHFEMVYRTAYYNPWPLKYVAAHPNAWRAIDYATALKLEKENPSFTNYTIDLSPTSDFENGIVLMQYFPGAYVNGTVLLSNGKPASGIRVTVLDQWGIPHYVTYTNSNGQYSAIAMMGNDTLVFSSGPLINAQENLTQIGNPLKEISLNVSYAAAMREPLINQSSGLPVYDIQMGTTVLSSTQLLGHVFFKHQGNFTYNPSYAIPVQNVSVRAVNSTSNLVYQTYAHDGFYNFSSMIPGDYNLYVVSGNKSILVARNVFVSYASSTVQNLGITPYFINGTVKFYNSTLSGVTVNIRSVSGNLQENVTTSLNGTFSASYLLPGNYTISLISEKYIMQPQVVDASPLNVTKPFSSLQLLAMPESSIEGVAYINSVPVSGAYIFFYGDVPGEGNYYTVTTQGGRFHLSLASGIYTYYSTFYLNSVPYVAFGNITTGSGLTLIYSRAYTVTGTVTGESGAPSQSLIYIENGSTILNISSNQQGMFSTLLPNGTYGIWASGQGAYLGGFSVSGTNITLRLSELAAMGYSGYSYTILTGVESNVSAAYVRISYNHYYYTFFTDEIGSYSINLPEGRTYPLTVSAPGYEVAQYTLSNIPRVELKLNPLPVNVVINYSTQVPLPQGSYLYLSPANDSAYMIKLSISGDTAQAALLPGTYLFNSTGYNNTVEAFVPSLSSLSIKPGHSYYANVTFSVRYRLAVYFTYPDGYSNSTAITRVDIFSHALPEPIAINNFVNGEGLFLKPANYTLYAYASVNGSAFAFLTAFTLSVPTTYTMHLSTVYELSGQTEYRGIVISSASVNITQLTTGAVIQAAVQSNGTFSVSLPSDNYLVNSTYLTTASYNGRARVVLYYASTTVDLVSSVNITLNATETPLNYTVSGTVKMFYGIPVQATLHFIAISATAMNYTVTTLSNGSYSIKLSPGVYTVETYASDASNITTLHLQTSSSFSPSLDFAYNVTGTVYADGIGPVNATVTFRSSDSSFNITSTDGHYSLLLPSGSYNVSATYSYTNEGTHYIYSFNSSLYLLSSTVFPITMQLVPTYSLNLTVLSHQNSPSSNGFAQVVLSVRNTGDVPDIVYLAVDTPNWYASFDPTYLVLGTGAYSNATVNVSLSSSNAAGGIDRVTFSAYSPISPSTNATASVNIAVPEHYGFSASFFSYGDEVPNRTVTFTLVVNNTGNTQSNFVAIMSNLPALREEGWHGGIYTTSSGPFYNETFFTLNPGKNQTLTVSLTAYGFNTTNVVPATITVIQRETNATYVITVPLALPNPVVSLSGVKVSGHGASAIPPPLITFRRATVIFILSAIIIASVYVAKKKRLIR